MLTSGTRDGVEREGAAGAGGLGVAHRHMLSSVQTAQTPMSGSLLQKPFFAADVQLAASSSFSLSTMHLSQLISYRSWSPSDKNCPHRSPRAFLHAAEPSPRSRKSL